MVLNILLPQVPLSPYIRISHSYTLTWHCCHPLPALLYLSDSKDVFQIICIWYSKNSSLPVCDPNSYSPPETLKFCSWNSKILEGEKRNSRLVANPCFRYSQFSGRAFSLSSQIKCNTGGSWQPLSQGPKWIDECEPYYFFGRVEGLNHPIYHRSVIVSVGCFFLS